MSRSPSVLLLAALLLAVPMAGALAADSGYGLGRVATAEEIAGWDIDVRPDGQGLPDGRGTAAEGEPIYLERCSVCHGEFGEAFGRYPVLMGGEDSLASQDPVKTVGSYWPYATTVWDYIRRAMPFGDAQSLTVDETYAVTAYLFYLNNLVEEDEVLDQDSLPALEMPNQAGFLLPDPRPDTPQGEPCMTDCKASVEITHRAAILDVTPTGENN